MNNELIHIGIVALAALLGAIIGIEREFADKPAGLRTHMFVGAASAMLIVLGDLLVEKFLQDQSSGVRADPIRIIQAIIVGTSFLGAGTIIHRDDDRVEGLTTASSILMTAAIGIAVAIGQVLFATGVTIFAVVVLAIVGQVEKRVARRAACQGLGKAP